MIHPIFWQSSLSFLWLIFFFLKRSLSSSDSQLCLKLKITWIFFFVWQLIKWLLTKTIVWYKNTTETSTLLPFWRIFRRRVVCHLMPEIFDMNGKRPSWDFPSDAHKMAAEMQPLEHASLTQTEPFMTRLCCTLMLSWTLVWTGLWLSAKCALVVCAKWTLC